ncbi:MAG: GTP-binding protein [Candidatus Odinarchaeum yellowstonii]|uniref:GTP-binding protein n=1 Tax=Odinarchaeota yellowstonii (strain LCB_4) TaxID=1841599 RepID=A0AAF0I9N8_ODILC|nr:MAG: GTP-binding protein [Candidatus Odinarchaeum yellowstonii]
MSTPGNAETHFVFKVLLLGDGAVGKTSLISMFTKGFIKQDYKMTIGVDIMAKTVKVDDKIAKLSIWDLAGQQRFKAIRSAFYGGVAGAMLVFDLTRALTFKNLVNWLQELYQFGNPECPTVIIGNKCDLVELRDVRQEDIDWFVSEIGSEYIQTSAKTGENVENAFISLTRKMIEKSTGKKIRITKNQTEAKYYTTIDAESIKPNSEQTQQPSENKNSFNQVSQS